MRRIKQTPPVVGLDMSLTGTAAVALPAGWDRDPAKVTSMLVGYPLVKPTQEARIARIMEIVAEVITFVRAAARDQYGDGWVTPSVFIEGYAFSMRSASVTQLAELGGAVRYALARDLGIVAREMTASTARKYLLGQLPKGKGTQKPAVVQALRACGFEFSSVDEYDAMCICNAGLAEVGGVGFSLMGDRSPVAPVA